MKPSNSPAIRRSVTKKRADKGAVIIMAGVGTEEKVLCALKKILPYHLFKSNFLYSSEGKQ